MKIRSFPAEDRLLRGQLAGLLSACFACYADNAAQEADCLLEERRIALAAVQGRGIGSALVARLEAEAAERDACLLYLGADDEEARTGLSNTDLYGGAWGKPANIQNLKRHPFEFYEKQGVRIVGVFPDAHGPGKPDIWMAKRVSR